MIPVIERFLAKISISDSGCWEWQGTKDTHEYGIFSINHKNLRSHRFIYEYYHGSISSILTIDHLCRNRKCVNPNHLEQVSIKINVLRGDNTCAINARKTHCNHGHPLFGDNLAIENGTRRCKTCHKERRKERLENYNLNIN